MTTADLRLYDDDGTEAFGEAGPFGAACHGPERVLHRVVYALLAQTNLVDDVRRAASSSDLLGAFTTAAQDTLEAAAEEADADAPADEVLTGVWLPRGGVVVGSGFVRLTVRVTVSSGASRAVPVVIPVDR